MDDRTLILSFEGPEALVRPDRCDARPLLDVLLRLVQLLEKIGVEQSGGATESPFAVVLKEVKAGSVRYCLDFAPRTTSDDPSEARKFGIDAARLTPKYLEARDTGPAYIRSSTKNLIAAIERLPPLVGAHLRGSVDAPLSELASSPPVPTAISIESFRAKILKAGGQAPRVQLKARGMDRPINLEAHQELAQRAGLTLYAEADVTARIERASDDRVLRGELLELRILEEGDPDPVTAFDSWYEKSGRPWAKIADIEKGLGRGE